MLAITDAVLNELAGQDAVLDATYNWLDGHPQPIDFGGLSAQEAIDQVMKSPRFQDRMRQFLTDVIGAVR